MRRILGALIGGFAAATFMTLFLHFVTQPRGSSPRRVEGTSPIDDLSESEAEALLRELDALS